MKSIFNECKWDEPRSKPVVTPPIFSPIIADPCVLTPEESNDGLWHMFAHSIYGIEHYISNDGFKWKKLKKVFPLSARPYVFKENNLYYLFFEKISDIFKFPNYKSEIQLSISNDLINWSNPITILSPYNVENGSNIENPFPIKIDNEYYLFHTFGLEYKFDCKFNEPKYSAYAISKNITGPYTISTDDSLIQPYKGKHIISNRLYRIEQLYYNFQSYYYRFKNHNYANIRIISSADLVNWLTVSDPILQLENDWHKTHIYVGDLKKYNNTYWFYFNGRNGFLFGTEQIGLATMNKAKS